LSSRPHRVAGALLAALLAIALLALTPSFAVVALLRDAAAPPEIAKVLPAAKEQLHKTRGFQWPAGYYRYLATETRTSDNLVVLHFEYRAYPFITASSAYRGASRWNRSIRARWGSVGDLTPNLN